MLEGLVKGGSLAKKQAMEKELEAWIESDPGRQTKYGDVLPALRALQAESEKTRERDAALFNVLGSSGYLGAGPIAVSLSVERGKADIDREAGFQERDWPRIREGQERIQRTLDVTSTVRCCAGRWVSPPRFRLTSGFRRWMRRSALSGHAGGRCRNSHRAVSRQLYAGTKLGERGFRLSLIEKSPADLVATNDTFIRLAAALEPLETPIARLRRIAPARFRA